MYNPSSSGSAASSGARTRSRVTKAIVAALPTGSPRRRLPGLVEHVRARLREAFRRTSYDADGVVAALGGGAHAALGRGEPVPAERATRDAGDLGTLIRLFLLG